MAADTREVRPLFCLDLKQSRRGSPWQGDEPAVYAPSDQTLAISYPPLMASSEGFFLQGA